MSKYKRLKTRCWLLVLHVASDMGDDRGNLTRRPLPAFLLLMTWSYLRNNRASKTGYVTILLQLLRKK